MTMVSPEIATAWPNEIVDIGIRGLEVGLLRPGPAAADEDVNGARLNGAVVGLITIHPGEALSSRGAPMTMVSPEIATAWPKESLVSGLEALR